MGEVSFGENSSRCKGTKKRRSELDFYLTGQGIAAYIQVRLRPAHQLAGVARSRSLFVATPLSGFRAPCIWAFLSSLRKMIISATAYKTACLMTCDSPNLP